MTKKSDRDAVINAFRKYARLGLHNRKLNPIQAYRAICGSCFSGSARLDLLAVSDTLRLLEINGDNDIISAVYAVYFATASHRLRKSEISNRIRRYAIESYCDERTVYRRLSVARDYYIRIRRNVGLFNEKCEL